MFTTGSKWFFGLGLVSLALAAAYGWTTGGNGLGPVTVGYKGGVGDHLGYSLLLAAGVAALLLGFVAVAIRDADSSALAQLAGTETAPTVAPPGHAAYWPVLTALGVTMVALGLVISNVLFIGAFIALIGIGVEWMVLAWSDRATGDPAVNRIVRNRVMHPYEVPIAGLLIAGGMVFAMSRVFLAASELGSVVAATAGGALVLLIGTLLATRPKMPSNAVAGLLVVVALGVLGAGVVAAAHGQRTIDRPEAPGGGQVAGTSDVHTPVASNNGLHAHVPAGTEHASTTTTTTTREAKG